MKKMFDKNGIISSEDLKEALTSLVKYASMIEEKEKFTECEFDEEALNKFADEFLEKPVANIENFIVHFEAPEQVYWSDELEFEEKFAVVSANTEDQAKEIVLENYPNAIQLVVKLMALPEVFGMRICGKVNK